MSEVLWPPDIIPSSQQWDILGNVGVFESPLSGAVRTVSRKGGRLSCKVSVPPINGQQRARLMAVLGALRDRSNVIWMPDFSTTVRGSFPVAELQPSPDFSTGWSVAGSATQSVSDKALRLTRTAYDSASGGNSAATTLSLTQYAPYAGRTLHTNGSYPVSNAGVTLYQSGGAFGTTSRGDGGMRTTTIVPYVGGVGTLMFYDYPEGASLFQGAGAYVDLQFASASRCIPVDGGLNALLYSDQVDNAAWSKNKITVSANAHTAPDGTVTAEGIVEDSTTGQHYFSQSASRTSQVEDVVAYGYFATIASSRDVRLAVLADGSNYATCIFNLSAGTAGSTSNVGTVTNSRAFILSAGSGWFFCAIVARLPATTTMSIEVDMVNAGSVSYLGNGTGRVSAWRVGVARSSLPTRGALTTTTATTGTNQSGSSVYVKGLPANTQGLLKAGSFVSCGGQGNIVTAALDSDNAGKGVLQCALPWRAGLADNDPIIVQTPMVKMRLASPLGWNTAPGQFSTFDLEFVEDVA